MVWLGFRNWLGAVSVSDVEQVTSSRPMFAKYSLKTLAIVLGSVVSLLL